MNMGSTISQSWLWTECQGESETALVCSLSVLGCGCDVLSFLTFLESWLPHNHVLNL